MTDFMNTVFQVVAGGIAVLMSVVVASWIALLWPALAEHHAH